MTDLQGPTICNRLMQEPLGSGVMGRVFCAYHVGAQRHEAVKEIYDRHKQKPSFVERFQQKVATLSTLQHENIIKIYEQYEDQGRLFLSMEFADAGSLRTLIEQQTRDRQPLRLDIGLNVAYQVAKALAYAHDRGVFHHDLKPENVLLVHRDPTRHRDTGKYSDFIVKLTDFGLTGIVDSAPTSSGITSSGHYTFAYMAPEQFKDQTLDGRTDIYALGLVLYELLTNRPPFDFTSGSFEEVATKHVEQAPHALDMLDPDRKQYSLKLNAIVKCCLAKAPDERYAKAADLVAALGALLRLGDGAKPKPTWADAVDLRVRVFDVRGNLFKCVALSQRGLSVGRWETNDLHLDSPPVARNHLQIRRGNATARVTDLGTRNGTWFNGARLPRNREQRWDMQQRLQIGPFTLCLEQATPARLEVDLAPKQITLTPGQGATVCLTIKNCGEQTDRVMLTAEGLPLPLSWLKALDPGQTLKTGLIDPGQVLQLPLTVEVPSAPVGKAGDYVVTLHVCPLAQPNVVYKEEGYWHVASVIRSKLVVTPCETTSREDGQYTVEISNDGNSSIQYKLSASDPEGALSCTLESKTVALDPGETAVVKLTVSAKWHLLRQRYPFTVRAEAPGGLLTATATFTQEGLLPF